MWISKFRVTSFSSFRDSGWIELDSRFNLFIGQNNSGKSAILRALSNPLPSNPHKDSNNFRGSNLHASQVSIDLEISLPEIISRFSAAGSIPTFPALQGASHQARMLEEYLNSDGRIISLELERKANSEAAPRGGASISNFRSDSNQSVLMSTIEGNSVKFTSGAPKPDNLSNLLSQKFGTIFYFDAQRLNVAVSGWDSPDKLHSNARNLPIVLAHLQGTRRPVFDKIEKHVVDILSGIERITVAPRQNNNYEILVWPDRNSNFEELSFSLDDSGTGVGQLLAILTAVVTSEQSIIIVDEINSFLHPAAVKKLLSLLRSEYPHHQYIISTHSADAISSCNAERIYIVNRTGFESSVKKIELEDANHAKEVAGTLGFSMMDVFGHERIVWVEGPTEEICFPYLIRKFGDPSDVDIGFSSVSSPSALTTGGRRDRAIVEIYERAGKQLAPLLRGMAFALDREKLSDDEVAKQERSKRKLRLLPRRCLECYLLVPAAITIAINDITDKKFSIVDVENCLRKNAEDVTLGASKFWNGDINNIDWLRRVDGANLLSKTFSDLSDKKIEYRKTRDAISILRNISDTDPSSLEELLAYLKKIVEIVRRDTPP